MPCVFEKAAFSSYPDFSGAILHERTSFTADDELWPTGKPDTDHIWQSRASCAVIRHNLGKQGLPEAEHFFYRREMEFSGHIGGCLQKLPYHLFGWVSDYGYSIERPVWGLVHVLYGTMLIGFFSSASGKPEDNCLLFFQMLGLSFTNLLNFLGLQRAYFDSAFLESLPWWVKVSSALESVSGVVLLFFLGLGLRQRFRLR